MTKYLILLSLLISGCTPFLKWQNDYPDNYLEEYVEDLIKEKTNQDIDLSPISGPENQKF